MRTTSSSFLIFLCISFCVLQISIPSFAEQAKVSARDSLIVIDPLPGPNPGYFPHAPSIVPISASFDAQLNSVILTFNNSLGEIEVALMNTSSWGYDFRIIDTQYLFAIIPLTLGSGHYLILFTLPSGQQYQGEFDR